jgi:hypothetical protein
VLLQALLILALGFDLLFIARIGAAWRELWLGRWPALAFAIAAIVEAGRGGFAMALGLGALACLSWFIAPVLLSPRPASKPAASPADIEARALLGVKEGATHAEIRRAHRAKMAKAHPDQGGAHAQAARLNAARDRLLGKQPR